MEHDHDPYTPHDTMDWLDVHYVTIELFRSLLVDLVNDLPATQGYDPQAVVVMLTKAIRDKAVSGNVFARGLQVSAHANGFTLLVTHKDQSGADPLFTIDLGNQPL